MRRRAVTLSLGVAVGLLALVGVAASATHYLLEPYNSGFLRYPTVVALHVVLGGVYLALAPFQFVKRIRSRHLAYHHRVGRSLVAVGLVVGATALFMGLAIPKGGWPERVVIGPGGHRPLRHGLPRRPAQRLPPRPRRKGVVAQGVDDPGLRYSARHRHHAPDLLPGAYYFRDGPYRQAVRDALGRRVGGGVRLE